MSIAASIILQCREASATSGDLTGLHFDFAKGEASFKLVADEAVLLGLGQHGLEAIAG